ncbi:hypothetical protein LINGRAHAP2_LOCUS13113 [Linum grandiflorum]
MQSFKVYDKVDEAEELAFRQQTRRRYNSSKPEILFKLSVQVAMSELSKLKEFPSKSPGLLHRVRQQRGSTQRFHLHHDIGSSSRRTSESEESDAHSGSATILHQLETTMENSIEWVSNNLTIVTGHKLALRFQHPNPQKKEAQDDGFRFEIS